MEKDVAIQNIEKALTDAIKMGVFQSLQDAAVVFSSLEIIKKELERTKN